MEEERSLKIIHGIKYVKRMWTKDYFIVAHVESRREEEKDENYHYDALREERLGPKSAYMMNYVEGGKSLKLSSRLPM